MTNFDFASATADELRAFISQAQDALRKHEAGPIRVAIQFPSYNEKRYSTPWIARVDSWPTGAQPTLTFGNYLGAPGAAGEAEILARPGAVVRWGQKDGRGNGTTSYWGVVQADGSVISTTAPEARSHFARNR